MNRFIENCKILNMFSRGIATFTLDWGTCPPWLFERMVKLGREIVFIIASEFGSEEIVKRVADPVWFQSLGTVLAFDWNASGLTTILTAALKEAIRGNEHDLGIFICGGKGKTSRKTPDEILSWGERLSLPEPQVNGLVYHSKMAAKVDSALVQDGYQIYHHAFFFSLPRRSPDKIGTKAGQNPCWSVVQQGMNTQNQSARRYHWYSDNIIDLVCEPHTGIASQRKNPTLDLTAKKSDKTREISTALVNQGYCSLQKDIKILRKHSSSLSRMIALGRVGEQKNPTPQQVARMEGLPTARSFLRALVGGKPATESVAEGSNNSETKITQQLTLLQLAPTEFSWHPVVLENFFQSHYLEKILSLVCEKKPKTYERLLATQGVGPKTMRALSLVAEVIYGAKPSYEDPARYSFAYGGKDGTPYPVERKTYDETIEFFKKVINKTKLSFFEKKRLVAKLSP
jgi:hypothetical protein